MTTIYIVSNHGTLAKRGDTLQLLRDGAVAKTIFPFKTEQLVISGNIEVTAQAMRLLMRHRIDTVFIGRNGRFAGKLLFEGGKNVFQRKKQYENLDKAEFVLAFCKAIVGGKLRNQLGFMQRLGRRIQELPDQVAAVARMKNLQQSLAEASSVESIRGIEGMAAKTYFSVYRHAIHCEWTRFTTRSMNPPLDPINAVLSFLYTLILYRVDAAIETAGLDGYVGYLHALDYGKKTLAFDLMEEFRTPLADTLTTGLFNMGTLQQDDFRSHDFRQESDEFPSCAVAEGEEAGQLPGRKGILLIEEGLGKVIAAFEKKLDSPVFYPPIDRSIPYREIFDHQVRHFRRFLMGEENTYKSFVPR